MNWLSPKAGGASGGLIGKPGMEYNAGSNSYTNAQGGTQVAGGAGASGATTGGRGSFGVGGDAYSVYGGAAAVAIMAVAVEYTIVVLLALEQAVHHS
jgi:hypothetical protein